MNDLTASALTPEMAEAIEDERVAWETVQRVRGGSHERDNLQTLCKPCNSRKGDR